MSDHGLFDAVETGPGHEVSLSDSTFKHPYEPWNGGLLPEIWDKNRFYGNFDLDGRLKFEDFDINLCGNHQKPCIGKIENNILRRMTQIPTELVHSTPRYNKISRKLGPTVKIDHFLTFFYGNFNNIFKIYTLQRAK